MICYCWCFFLLVPSLPLCWEFNNNFLQLLLSCLYSFHYHEKQCQKSVLNLFLYIFILLCYWMYVLIMQCSRKHVALDRRIRKTLTNNNKNNSQFQETHTLFVHKFLKLIYVFFLCANDVISRSNDWHVRKNCNFPIV